MLYNVVRFLFCDIFVKYGDVLEESAFGGGIVFGSGCQQWTAVWR